MNRAVLAWALPAAPGIVALIGLLLNHSAKRVATALGVAGAAVALIAAVALAVSGGSTVESSTQLIDFGGLPVTLSVRADAVAALVAIAVALVALAVQIYSIAYLSPDDRYAPYASQVSLFTAAMMLVVVSGDLILLLVGWEVMGICSYLLIGHDRKLPEAPRSAVKAFIVTRVGDVGFLLGIALLGTSAGSFRLADVLTAHYSHGRLVAATLLLLAGAAGKSAQFPLHSWLPDAMAGPTPISALIHAATMVAAGIYMISRLYPLFLQAPQTLAVMAVMASITMLFAAFAATAQDDIKRVLAWSTVSQIAYMLGALAVGAAPAALFHLLSHAGFKALLFLCAGCVIHAVGSNSMSIMGGLRKYLPVTFWCMTIGLAALAGVPPFAGFWSKDEVLAVAAQARDGQGAVAGWVGWLVWLAGLVTALLTAWYATRLWLRTFFGESRGEATPHEAPALMRWPIIVLAVPAALFGFTGLFGGFARRLGTDSLAGFDALSVLPLLCLIVGAGLAWWTWRRAPAADPARALGPALPVFANAFYFDQLQEVAVVRPATALARVVRRTDESIVDGAVRGTGGGTVRLGSLVVRGHRGPLPWAAGAALGGAVVLAIAAVVLVGA